MSEQESRKEKRMRSGNSSAKVCGSEESGRGDSGPRRRKIQQTKFIGAVALTLSEPGVTVYVGAWAPQIKLISSGSAPSPPTPEGFLLHHAMEEGRG